MASIERRRGKDGKLRYRVRIRRKGAPSLSQSFARLSDARAYATRMEADIASGRHIPSRQGHTLQEAVERYLDSPGLAAQSITTQRQNQWILNWWAARLGQYRLNDIPLSKIIEHRDELLKTRKPNTVRGYVAWLRNLYNVAKDEWQWVDQTPFSRRVQPQLGELRLRVLTDEERERLLEACRTHVTPYLYTQVLLALSTGARQMEIVRLQWRQIDFERRLVTFERTKTNERRSVALAGLALRAMQEHAAAATDSAWVFPPRRKTKHGEPTFNQAAWERCREQAGLEDFHFHDLRHTAASYLAMNGATMLEIAYILGHKDISMTQRYAHLTNSHTVSVLERMNRAMLGEAGE